MKQLDLVEKNQDNLIALSAEFRAGRRSPVDYLRHLEQLYDKREPYIKAFVQEPSNPFMRLKKELEQLNTKYPDPASYPPLFGIPVGVKDIFNVDGFPTRAGSKLPPEVIGGPEAAVVKRLKSAGALILGKTVTVQFANWGPGPTCNPYNLEHTPGGSSSGSAAAVSAGLCPLALGTQTIGSVIRPAAYCGVVGVKPTYGRIPMDGIIPLAPSLDHVGFITADVEGATLAASILIDRWNPIDISESTIFGVPKGPYLERMSKEGIDHFNRTCKLLADAGVQIKFLEMFNNFKEIVAINDRLFDAEFAIVHSQWFSKYSERYCEGNQQSILRGRKVDPGTLETCRAHRKDLKNEILNSMARHNITALLAPAATGPAPKGLDKTGEWVINLP